MKNLAILFCSIRPSNKKNKINDFREIEYLNCLKQLKRVIPKNFDILICENTIDKMDEIINTELKSFLQDNKAIFMGSINNNTDNIGFGELLMLYNSLKFFDKKKYRFISYISARKIFTCPYVFERTNTLKKDILISNPDFLFLNGKYRINPKKGLYNDMFFSMKKKFIIEYANFAYQLINKKIKFFRYNLIRKKPAGSEQILFEYIKKKKLSYDYLDWLGIVRNESGSDNFININNFHIC